MKKMIDLLFMRPNQMWDKFQTSQKRAAAFLCLLFMLIPGMIAFYSTSFITLLIIGVYLTIANIYRWTYVILTWNN